MRIYVQIEFGQDIEAATSFLEDNDLDGRVLFDCTAKEAREHLEEVRAEDADEDEDEAPAGELH